MKIVIVRANDFWVHLVAVCLAHDTSADFRADNDSADDFCVRVSFAILCTSANHICAYISSLRACMPYAHLVAQYRWRSAAVYDLQMRRLSSRTLFAFAAVSNIHIAVYQYLCDCVARYDLRSATCIHKVIDIYAALTLEFSFLALTIEYHMLRADMRALNISII